eukprot:4426767-Alexandrium_andersonii.AAC.1
MPEVVHAPSAACEPEVDAALPRTSWRRIPAAGRALAGRASKDPARVLKLLEALHESKETEA